MIAAPDGMSDHALLSWLRTLLASIMDGTISLGVEGDTEAFMKFIRWSASSLDRSIFHLETSTPLKGFHGKTEEN